MTASRLRWPSRSLSQPENNLTIAAVASLIPSISPTSAALAPRLPTRNTGNRLWIISDEISMNIETKPNAQTPRGTARKPCRCWLISIWPRPRLLPPAANRRARPAYGVAAALDSFNRAALRTGFATQRRGRLAQCRRA